MVAPTSPSSIVHLQNEGNNFAEGNDVNTGYDLEDEGTDAIVAGPGATNENVLPNGDDKRNKNHQSMDVDDIVNIDEDELKDNNDDDLIIQEIETAQGPQFEEEDDIDYDIETMG